MLKTAKLILKLPSRASSQSYQPPKNSSKSFWLSKNAFSNSKPQQRSSHSKSKKAFFLAGAAAFLCFSVSDYVSCTLNLNDKEERAKTSKDPSTNSQNTSTRPDQGSSVLRYSANVLILGESQSGKSTFIQRLHSLAGLDAPSSLKIGAGGEATTSSTNIYHVPIKIRELSLVKGGRDVDWERALSNYDFFDDLADDRELVLKPGKVVAEVDLNLIDTPGLKGTDKNDEDNMFDLLQTLTDVGSVNCVMVLNKGSNYGPNFEETLLYYQEMLGQTVPVHMVHTKYTTDDILKDLGLKINSYNNSARIQEFKKLFPHISGEHWLIDSIPKPNRPFREFLTNYTIFTWLASIASERSISTKDLNFTKTKKMKTIDKLTQSRNQALSEGHGSGLANKNLELQSILRKITALSRTIDDQKHEIDKYQNELDVKNSKTPEFMKTQNVSHAWSIWPVAQEHEVNIHAPDPIMEVEKVIFNQQGSYWVPQSESVYGEEALSREYSIRIASKIWRGCYASISFYTYKKYKYEDQLPLLEEIIKSLTLDYWKNIKELYDYKIEHQEFKKTIINLEQQIQTYNDTNPKIIEKKIPFNFYKQVEKIYKSEHWDSASTNELHKLAERLTQAYHQYFFQR